MDARFAAGLMLGLCVSLAADAQSLFKCAKGGKVVYQDSKCDDDAKQSTVRPPDAPADRRIPAAEASADPKGPGAPSDAAKTDAPKSDPAKSDPAKAGGDGGAGMAVNTVVEIISNYEGCAADFPAFAAKYGRAFDQWKTRNHNAITRYNQDGAARRKVADSLEIQRKMSRDEDAEGRAEKSERCDKVIGPLVEGKR